MPSKRPTTDDPTAHPAPAAAAAAEPTTSAIGDYDLPKTTVTKIAKSAVSSRAPAHWVGDFVASGADPGWRD